MIFLMALAMQVTPEAFTYSEKIDPINDTRTVQAVAGEARAQIVVYCVPKEHFLWAQVRTSEFIPKTGFLDASYPMTYRFDQDKPITKDWHYTSGEIEPFALSSENTRFIFRLLTASKIAVRTSPVFGSTPIEAVVDLPGDHAPIKRVVSECGNTKVARLIAGEK